jgi:hypothetical protein
MNKADLRAIIDGVTGDPTNGAVAEVVPAIVDALDAALNGGPAKPEQRIISADEIR